MTVPITGLFAVYVCVYYRAVCCVCLCVLQGSLLFMSVCITGLFAVYDCAYYRAVCCVRPKGGRGLLMSHPVWHLRAVIWFHFAISSLVLLPSADTLSVFFCLLVRSSELFPEKSSIFFVCVYWKPTRWLCPCVLQACSPFIPRCIGSLFADYVCAYCKPVRWSYPCVLQSCLLIVSICIASLSVDYVCVYCKLVRWLCLCVLQACALIISVCIASLCVDYVCV